MCIRDRLQTVRSWRATFESTEIQLCPVQLISSFRPPKLITLQSSFLAVQHLFYSNPVLSSSFRFCTSGHLCARWEVIDVVRTLSTEKVKAGEEGTDSFKFSRFFGPRGPLGLPPLVRSSEGLFFNVFPCFSLPLPFCYCFSLFLLFCTFFVSTFFLFFSCPQTAQ